MRGVVNTGTHMRYKTDKLDYDFFKDKGLLTEFAEMTERISRKVEVSATWMDPDDMVPHKTLFISGQAVLSYSVESLEDERALGEVTLGEQLDYLEKLIWAKMADMDLLGESN
jgi:hypothetical protein